VDNAADAVCTEEEGLSESQWATEMGENQRIRQGWGWFWSSINDFLLRIRDQVFLVPKLPVLSAFSDPGVKHTPEFDKTDVKA
jgi:hypothetical protein